MNHHPHSHMMDTKAMNRQFVEEMSARKASADTHFFWTQVARNSHHRHVLHRDRMREDYQLFNKNSEWKQGGIEDSIPVERSGPGADEIPILETFAELDDRVEPFIKRNIQLMRYEVPTPIQKHSIPLGINGVDLMCCAQTGSGKTFAFLLPVVEFMCRPVEVAVPDPSSPDKMERTLSMGHSSGSGHDLFFTSPAHVRIDNKMGVLPRAVILAPTRELASQIHVEARKLCYGSDIKVVCVYGGADIRTQLIELSTGCDLIVATPGRLTDLVERGIVSLSQVQFLVLDEADRMLDMGFEPQIRRIVQGEDMPDKLYRQTFLFSATFPNEIQTLAREFLRDYVWVGVGRVGSTVENIQQRLILTSSEAGEKIRHLVEAIQYTDGRTLVFVQRKKTATWICSCLNRQLQIPAEEIHGDRTQQQREYALRLFRSGRTRVLVATDVAARGLDIPEVTHVIQFDLPVSPDDFDTYVHRIGRTGRVGKQGVATSFFVPGRETGEGNGKIAHLIMRLLQETQQEIPDWFIEAEQNERGGGGYRDGGGRFGGRRPGVASGGVGGRFGGRDTRTTYQTHSSMSGMGGGGGAVRRFPPGAGGVGGQYDRPPGGSGYSGEGAGTPSFVPGQQQQYGSQSYQQQQQYSGRVSQQSDAYPRSVGGSARPQTSSYGQSQYQKYPTTPGAAQRPAFEQQQYQAALQQQQQQQQQYAPHKFQGSDDSHGSDEPSSQDSVNTGRSDDGAARSAPIPQLVIPESSSLTTGSADTSAQSAALPAAGPTPSNAAVPSSVAAPPLAPPHAQGHSYSGEYHPQHQYTSRPADRHAYQQGGYAQSGYRSQGGAGAGAGGRGSYSGSVPYRSQGGSHYPQHQQQQTAFQLHQHHQQQPQLQQQQQPAGYSSYVPQSVPYAPPAPQVYAQQQAYAPTPTEYAPPAIPGSYQDGVVYNVPGPGGVFTTSAFPPGSAGIAAGVVQTAGGRLGGVHAPVFQPSQVAPAIHYPQATQTGYAYAPMGYAPPTGDYGIEYQQGVAMAMTSPGYDSAGVPARVYPSSGYAVQGEQYQQQQQQQQHQQMMQSTQDSSSSSSGTPSSS